MLHDNDPRAVHLRFSGWFYWYVPRLVSQVLIFLVYTNSRQRETTYTMIPTFKFHNKYCEIWMRGLHFYSCHKLHPSPKGWSSQQIRGLGSEPYWVTVPHLNGFSQFQSFSHPMRVCTCIVYIHQGSYASSSFLGLLSSPLCCQEGNTTYLEDDMQGEDWGTCTGNGCKRVGW